MKLQFIKEAERVHSFNLDAKPFTSLTYKKEIQHLFNKHYFPDFDLSNTIDTVDMTKLNRLIAELKRYKGGQMFSKLHNYKLDGVGPGEVTLYFLISDAYIGGGNAKVDLFVGNKTYEIKAADISPKRVASNFKLGSTVDLSAIIQKLYNLAKSLKLDVPGATSIPGSVIDKMRATAPVEFKAIEQEYAKTAYNYFKGSQTIFINNKPGMHLGRIEAVKSIQTHEITIERVTAGTIKPRIQL